MRIREVRDELKDERQDQARVAQAPVIRHLTSGGGMSEAHARAATNALTAVTLRAGGIIAAKRAPFALTEHLCLGIVMAGVVSDDRMASADRSMTGSGR